MTLGRAPNAEDSCLKNQQPPREGESLSSTPTFIYDSSDQEKGGSFVSQKKQREDLSDGRDSSGPDSDTIQDLSDRTDDEGANSNSKECENGLARQPSAATTIIDFPEGGLQGWLVVFGSFCAMISVFGLINSAAVFESYFSTHQLVNHSASEIGWIFSLYLFIVFFVGIQVGPIFDRYGARLLVAVGSLLVVLSLMLLSLSKTYYQIMLTYSVLGGLGGALLNCPAYGSITHFFNVRRGLATGVATISGGIGGIIFPIMLRSTLPSIGFPWSCRILGFIMLGLAVPANLFIKTRLKPKATHEKPKISHLLPDFSGFRDLRYAFSAIGIFFMEWGLFMPLTYIVSYAAAHGQDATESYLLLAYLNAGSVLGRVLPGLFADKLGRFNVVIITISLCVILVFAMWLPAAMNKSVLIGYAVLFGFASGSNLGLVPVCLGQLCDARQFGRYYSTAMMVASFGTLSSVPIGGALLEMGSGETGWRGVIIFSGLSYFIALACYTSARVLAVGFNPRTKF